MCSISVRSGSRHRGRVNLRHAAVHLVALLVDGNPLEDINLIADPDRNFVVIMKDGKVYKNMLPK